MRRVGIALGSNLGDKRDLMQKARDFCKELNVSGEPFLQSHLYASCAVECPPGSDDYLNAFLEFTWAGVAESLLMHCMAIEVKLGRPQLRMRNAPRTADVDLIYIDDLVINQPHLTIPHPRAHLRKFVLVPMADVRPDFVLPHQTKTVTELLGELVTDEPDPVLVTTDW